VFSVERTDEGWVHRLYLQEAPNLYRMAAYRLQDDELAYDLTQEVFLALLDKAGELKNHPNQSAWLRKTMNHKILHQMRKQIPVPLPYDLVDPRGEPGRSLDEVLPRQLSPQDRQILKLAYEDRLTYEEIGKILHISPSTCGTWLYRARNRCKHYLTLEKGGPPHARKD
jgi:RNA polymerase sigma-70 factor (ECF subfamily)